jgi:hypothetical protein
MVMKIIIEANVLRYPPSPLAASPQVSRHAQAQVMVDLPKGFRRIASGEIVGPTSQVEVEFFDEFGQRFCALVIPAHLPPFRTLSREGLLARLPVPILLATAREIAFIAKAIAQELQLLGPPAKVKDAGFLPVDFQPKPRLRSSLR